MSSAAGPGLNHPSARQPTDTDDTAGEGAPGYSDIDTSSPTAAQPATSAGAAALGQHAVELDNVDDADAQPLDPSLIAGGENLVGAANHVATGVDAVDANFGDEEDAPARVDHEGLEQEHGSRNTP